MDFTNTPTDTLLKVWANVKGGLDKVAKSLDNGTFNKVGDKGAAPPSQSGQTTLWFAMAIDNELTKRKVKH
jgi:hypothetical protein